MTAAPLMRFRRTGRRARAPGFCGRSSLMKPNLDKLRYPRRSLCSTAVRRRPLLKAEMVSY